MFTGMAGGQATDEGIKTNSYYGGGGGSLRRAARGGPDKPAARGVRALSRTGGVDAVNAFVTLLLKIWGAQNVTKKMAKQRDGRTKESCRRTPPRPRGRELSLCPTRDGHDVPTSPAMP